MKHTITLFALAFITGCAVLQIDVDVYKGPLANHERVQMEQVAVLAVGARPLLVELRNRLECPNDPDSVRLIPGYRDGYVSVSLDSPTSDVFSNTMARNVNAILGLYEPRDSRKPDQVIVSRAVMAFRSYLENRARLDGESIVTQETADRLEHQMQDGSALSAGLDTEAVSSSIESLRKAYTEEYLQPPRGNSWRKRQPIFIAHYKLLRALGDSASEYGIRPLKLNGVVFDEVTIETIGSNAENELIETDSMVTDHAKLLFNEASPRTEFETRVREIAASFRRAREDLEVVWRAAIAYLLDFPTGEHRDLAIDVVRLLTITTDHSASGVAPSETNSDNLLRSPDSVIQLLSKHEARKRQDISTAMPRLIADTRYGLVRGPTVDDGGLNSGEVRALTNSLGDQGILARGRLDKGLLELIEKYLEAAYSSEANRIGSDRNRLLDGLAHFSRSLKTLSNLNIFLGSSADVRNYVDTLEAISTSIETEVDSLQWRKTHQDNLTRRGDQEVESLKVAVTTSDSQERSESSVVGRLAGGDAKGLDTRDTLDRLIASLHYRLVEVAEKQGADSEPAKRLRAAIDIAEEHRSGMVFIQPAAAFLKNSYPASGLQRDSLVNWSNLLDQHSLRQVPLIGGLIENGPRATQRELLDKQYWHNVNRVRVAGAGTTNYVLAKDDIGNWYVKNYDSDPEEIIKGAKSLALFAAHGAIDREMIERSSAPEGVSDQTNHSSGPLLVRMIDSVKAESEVAAASSSEEFRAIVLGLPERLRRDWASRFVGDELRSHAIAFALAIEMAGKPSLPEDVIDSNKSFEVTSRAATAWLAKVNSLLISEQIAEEVRYRTALVSVVMVEHIDSIIQNVKLEISRLVEKKGLLEKNATSLEAGTNEENTQAQSLRKEIGVLSERLKTLTDNLATRNKLAELATSKVIRILTENIEATDREEGGSTAAERSKALREALKSARLIARIGEKLNVESPLMSESLAREVATAITNGRGDLSGANSNDETRVAAFERMKGYGLDGPFSEDRAIAVNRGTDLVRNVLRQALDARHAQIRSVESQLKVIGAAAKTK